MPLPELPPDEPEEPALPAPPELLLEPVEPPELDDPDLAEPPDVVLPEREVDDFVVLDFEPVGLARVDLDRVPAVLRLPAAFVFVTPDLAADALLPVDLEPPDVPVDLVRDLVPLVALLARVPVPEPVVLFLDPPVLFLVPLLEDFLPPAEEEPVLPLDPLLLLLPVERLVVPPPIRRRTASVAAVTIAAPILLALSVAVSAASCTSSTPSRTVLRTFWLAVSAAAAVTSPAASMLRATGFWASSAAFSPASRSALPMGDELLLLGFVFLLSFEPLLPPDLLPEEDFVLAIALSSSLRNSSVTDVRRRERFPCGAQVRTEGLCRTAERGD